MFDSYLPEKKRKKERERERERERKSTDVLAEESLHATVNKPQNSRQQERELRQISRLNRF